MSTLQDQIVAFENMRDVLETERFGKWVIVHDKKLGTITFAKMTARFPIPAPSQNPRTSLSFA